MFFWQFVFIYQKFITTFAFLRMRINIWPNLLLLSLKNNKRNENEITYKCIVRDLLWNGFYLKGFILSKHTKSLLSSFQMKMSNGTRVFQSNFRNMKSLNPSHSHEKLIIFSEKAKNVETWDKLSTTHENGFATTKIMHYFRSLSVRLLHKEPFLETNLHSRECLDNIKNTWILPRLAPDSSVP